MTVVEITGVHNVLDTLEALCLMVGAKTNCANVGIGVGGYGIACAAIDVTVL